MRSSAIGLALLIVATAGVARAQNKECVAASDEGQQERDQGKYQKARAAFALCARDTCPALIRRDCGQWLNDLNQTWPSVVVSAKDDKGADLVDVKVSLDGALLTPSLTGAPLQVDPGQHVLRYETANFPPTEEKVLIVAGEKNRILKVQFGGPVRAAVSTSPVSSPPSQTPDSNGPATHAGGPPALAWVFTGVAALAFGSEAYFGLTGLSQRSSDMSQPCATTKTCDVSGIRTDFAVADISLGVGVASALVATYFFVFGGAKSTPATSVGFAPLPGGGAATLTAGF
jgi:hypothetical protein